MFFLCLQNVQRRRFDLILATTHALMKSIEFDVWFSSYHHTHTHTQLAVRFDVVVVAAGDADCCEFCYFIFLLDSKAFTTTTHICTQNI